MSAEGVAGPMSLMPRLANSAESIFIARWFTVKYAHMASSFGPSVSSGQGLKLLSGSQATGVVLSGVKIAVR